MTAETPITITAGDDTVSGIYTRPESPFATIVIAHGAGAGMDHPFMSGFTRAMADAGAATLRFNLFLPGDGQKFPDRPPMTVDMPRIVMEETTARSGGEPLWASGKSFGGRMASRALAEGMKAAGLVFLGYPLHTAGKTDYRQQLHIIQVG